MAKKQKFDGIIVKRETVGKGFVVAYDKNDPLCWDAEQRERVVLIEDDVLELHEGPEQVYAFSFASLRRLAEIDGHADYPIKVGYTASEIGAIARVRGLMGEMAGFPERPQLPRH